MVWACAGAARAEWPSLEQAVTAAQTRSQLVVRAQAEIGVAQAEQRGARVSAIGNPLLDMQIDRGSRTTKDVQALAFLYTPIEIFGQRGARIDESDALKNWREIGLLDARAQATGEVLAAYGALRVACERLSIAGRGEQAARAEASYFDGRFEARDATIYDRSLAHAEVSRWLQMKAEAVLQLTQARVELLRLTGQAAWNEDHDLPAIAPPALRRDFRAAQQAAAAERSPSLRGARAEGLYWGQAKKRWQAERRMPFELLLIGGRGDPGDFRLGAGFTLRFPISRRNQGEIARAEAQQSYIEQLTPVLKTTVMARIDGAQKALFSLLDALKTLDEEGIPASEKAVEASYEGYKRGKLEMVQVLIARRELALAQSRRLDLLASAWRAYAELAALSGDWP